MQGTHYVNSPSLQPVFAWQPQRMTLIAGRLPLPDVMTALSARRPVFHSEADFQFEFAQTVADLDPAIRIRLEVPQRRDDTKRSAYVDLLCETDGQGSLIEFKYVTRSWNGNDPNTDERFELRNHSATDLARLHFIHDVYRCQWPVGTAQGRS